MNKSVVHDLPELPPISPKAGDIIQVRGLSPWMEGMLVIVREVYDFHVTGVSVETFCLEPSSLPELQTVRVPWGYFTIVGYTDYIPKHSEDNHEYVVGNSTVQRSGSAGID